MMIICIVIDIILLYIIYRTDIVTKQVKYKITHKMFVDGEMKDVYDVEEEQCKRG